MISLPNKKYNIIYADPPWHFQNYNNAKAQTNPQKHYPTMSMKEIAELPVGDIADKDCISICLRLVNGPDANGFKLGILGIYAL